MFALLRFCGVMEKRRENPMRIQSIYCRTRVDSLFFSLQLQKYPA